MGHESFTYGTAWVEELKATMAPTAVLVDDQELAKYHSDCWPLSSKRAASGRPQGRPDAVVKPGAAEDVTRLLAFADARGIPVVPWGLGSSVVGAPLAQWGGIICDLRDLTGVVELSTEDLWVRVRAGTRGDQLEAFLNDAGLTLGHSPQSLGRSTVGGWVATRATGQFSTRYGGIEDLLISLEVALPQMGLIRTPMLTRAALGPDLAGLFVGNEGTLGIITEVALKVSPLPQQRMIQAAKFSSVTQLVGALRGIAQQGTKPFLVRGYDEAETEHLTGGEHDGCVMLLGCEGDAAVCEAEYSGCIDVIRAHGGKLLGSDLVERWMANRFDFSTIENVASQPGGYAETIELGAFWSDIESLHTGLTQALDPHAEHVWGHFSHVYPQGTSLYMIITGHDEDDDAAIHRLEKIWDIAMRVCLECGGTIAHHHGIGLARKHWLNQSLGSAARPLKAIKRALDPSGVLNPGKLTYTRIPAESHERS